MDFTRFASHVFFAHIPIIERQEAKQNALTENIMPHE